MASTAKPKSSSSALPRRRFFDDMPDKGLFAFVAVFGFAMIMWLKVQNYNVDLVAALAVAIMVAYGVIAFQIPAVQLRPDRLGDNFYYLGFIYTLASMAAALMQLRGQIEIQPILGSFGIALITTIVGVAGRVLFVQMRSEIDDVQEQTRRDLLKASEELRGQLALALRDFETFSTAVRQTADETAKQSTASAQKQVELIGDVARVAANEIRIAFETSRSGARELGETIQKVAKAVDQTNENFARMELPTRRFEQQLDGFGAQLQALLGRLAAAAEAANAVRRSRRRWYWPFKRVGAAGSAPRRRRRWYWPFGR